MYIFGRNPVIEALRAGKQISKIYFRFGVHGPAILEIQHLARKRNIPAVELPKQRFDRLGDTSTSQGIAALIEEIATVELEDLLALRREQDPPFFIALDSMKDPHNLGAIIRSAECAGAHGIILPRHESAMITDVVVKASAGAISHLRVARVSNLHQALQELKRSNIWIAGLDSDGETDLFAFDGNLPLCIVVGSEKGIRPLIKKSCDFIVRIPMWGRIDSLNASVAAALMMYEIRRKRI